MALSRLLSFDHDVAGSAAAVVRSGCGSWPHNVTSDDGLAPCMIPAVIDSYGGSRRSVLLAGRNGHGSNRLRLCHGHGNHNRLWLASWVLAGERVSNRGAVTRVDRKRSPHKAGSQGSREEKDEQTRDPRSG